MPEHTARPSIAAPANDVVGQFLEGILDREAWTHPAHLLVCRHLLQRATVHEVLDELRLLIPAHNERVGLLPNHGGYHETVTRYFVEAVAAADVARDHDLLAEPSCRREAPLDHWSRSLLESAAARARWVEPDLTSLPWSRRGGASSATRSTSATPSSTEDQR